MAPQFNQQGIWHQQQPQQHQGNYDYYNGTNNSGLQFNNSQYPSGASAAPEWNAVAQNWSSWQPQPQQSGGMMQHPLPQSMPLNGANNSAANGAKQCDSFQRTFDYVQQCQGWTGQQWLIKRTCSSYSTLLLLKSFKAVVNSQHVKILLQVLFCQVE